MKNKHIFNDNKKKHSPTLWYRGFYDIVYSRAISTNFRRHCFQFNNHNNIGLRYRNQILCMFLEQPSPGMLNVKRLKKATTFIRYAQRQKTEKTTTFIRYAQRQKTEKTNSLNALRVIKPKDLNKIIKNHKLYI